MTTKQQLWQQTEQLNKQEDKERKKLKKRCEKMFQVLEKKYITRRQKIWRKK